MRIRMWLIAIILTFQSTAALADFTVDKERWLDEAKDIFPSALCRDGGFVRSCFQVTAEECHLLLTDMTKSCLLQYKEQIPQQLQQPKDGTEWGTKVGICVGTVLEADQASRRIHNEQCDDLNAWKR